MRNTFVRDILVAGAAILAAFLLYAFLGATGPRVLRFVNAFSLAVVCFAVRRGEVFGAVLGTVCGLVQDSFSLGVFGVAGLTKTLLGFWTGYVARRIDVVPFFRSTVFLLVMSSLELAAWTLLHVLIRVERLNFGGGGLLLQPLATAVLGSFLLALERRLRARRS